MFVLRESATKFEVLFAKDSETIGKFETYDEAYAFLEDYAKRVPYVAYVRIVDTEFRRGEKWFSWKDGVLVDSLTLWRRG